MLLLPPRPSLVHISTNDLHNFNERTLKCCISKNNLNCRACCAEHKTVELSWTVPVSLSSGFYTYYCVVSCIVLIWSLLLTICFNSMFVLQTRMDRHPVSQTLNKIFQNRCTVGVWTTTTILRSSQPAHSSCCHFYYRRTSIISHLCVFMCSTSAPLNSTMTRYFGRLS